MENPAEETFRSQDILTMASSIKIPCFFESEETFRNQDILIIGRCAANATVIHGLRLFTAFFRYALPAVRSHRPPVCAENIRGVLGGPLLKPTSRRKPRWRSLPSKGDGNGTAIIKKKP